MKKRILSLIVAASMMLALSVSAFATGGAISAISGWAVGTMVDGERYGIYPISWYEGDMGLAITKEQASALVSGVGDKLSKIEGTVVKGENPVEQPAFTRGAVLTELAEEVAQLDLPGNTQLEQDAAVLSAVDFMQKYGVVMGNGVDLALEAPCTVEQAVVFSTRLITNVYHQLDSGSQGFFWKAEKNGNTVYMLGSIHAGDDTIYPYRQEISDAFKDSESLHVEVNILDVETLQASLLKYASCPEGKTLKDYVSDETYQLTLKALEKVGLTEEIVAPYKPWYVNIVLGNYLLAMGKTEEEMAASGMYGIDMHLMSSALVSGKPIVEIESADLQYKMFDDFSPELQEYQLAGSAYALVNGIPTDESTLDTMLKPFMNGDAAALAGMASTDYTGMSAEEKKLNEEYTYALLTNRNKGMTDAVAKLLESDEKGTYFVVVGALHYVGQDNIIDMLKAKGYNPVLVP